MNPKFAAVTPEPSRRSTVFNPITQDLSCDAASSRDVAFNAAGTLPSVSVKEPVAGVKLLALTVPAIVQVVDEVLIVISQL